MSDDDGLDDFFAKKDKKGKSKKNKFAAAELLDEGAQPQKTEKPKKKKKPKEKSDASKTTGDTKNEEQEEEWIEVEDEEVNYTGLKIKTLQIVDETEQDRENQEQEEDEDGEIIGSKNTNQGPWAGVVQTQLDAGHPAPAPEESGDKPVQGGEKKDDSTKAAPSRYMPPGMRKALMEEANNPELAPLRRGKPRMAPDIQSKMHFPTLGGTSTDVDRQRDKEFERENPKGRFETVRSGNRQLADSSKGGLKLEIENKFDLLQDDN